MNTPVDEEARVLAIQAKFNIHPGDMVDGKLLIERKDIKHEIDKYLQTDEGERLISMFRDLTVDRESYKGTKTPPAITESGEQKLRGMIARVNRLKDYQTTPENVVMVTIEDIIEIVHEIVPYTMQKLDDMYNEQALRGTGEGETLARIDELVNHAKDVALDDGYFFDMGYTEDNIKGMPYEDMLRLGFISPLIEGRIEQLTRLTNKDSPS